LRPWSWNGRPELVSDPVRCARDQWYLVRARLTDGARLTQPTLLAVFFSNGEALRQRCLRLLAGPGPDHELLGWLETPPGATHLQVCIPDPAVRERLTEVVFHKVSERDPKCHPLANVPRWSSCRPPFAIRRVALPSGLGELKELLGGVQVELRASPRSLAELAGWARGAACVLDPQWVNNLKLTWADLERLAATSWLLADLDTTARLAAQAGVAKAELVTHVAAHGLMSARAEYADVPTRGLALQDVVPYATWDPAGGFCARAIRADASWRQYADRVGFATLLACETPWAQKHGDVLSAIRAVGGGELIATDLPWLVAGHHGPLLAPRLAAHLLRMHLAEPLADHVQYWNRWEDADVVVRDIADLAGRYPPLRTVRWASADPALAHLGVTLAQSGGRPTRQVIIRTGRIDNLSAHDGLPPEPMMILMKWLAREVREQTPWARRHLTDSVVTWQFDTADGLKYAVQFDAAESPGGQKPAVVRVRIGGPAEPREGAAGLTIRLTQDEGLFGDRSVEFQDTLMRSLRRVIEGQPVE
jgi:hypothetical protein